MSIFSIAERLPEVKYALSDSHSLTGVLTSRVTVSLIMAAGRYFINSWRLWRPIYFSLNENLTYFYLPHVVAKAFS